MRGKNYWNLLISFYLKKKKLKYQYMVLNKKGTTEFKNSVGIEGS